MDFVNKLKMLRKKKKMTQSQLAEVLQTSKSNISKYEANSIEPNFETLIKIAHFFDVSANYLLGFKELKASKTITSEKAIISLDTEMKKALSDSFDELNLDNKYIIVGEAKKLLKEQRREESIELTDIERKVEEAIRTQKGNLDTKIG